MEIPYGSKSGPTEAKKRNPTNIEAGLDSLMTDINSNYDSQSQDVPCLRNRQRIYWTGGAAWATATLMHPESALNGWVTISKRDLDNFIEKLKNNSWDQPPLFAFSKDTSPERRAAIRKKEDFFINDSKDGIINIFTREQLLSGASIMRAVLNSSNPSATLRFVRGGNFVFGVALAKFKEDSPK